MNRKTFLTSLAGLMALPKILKAKPEYPLISNKDFFLPPIDLWKYPLTEKEVFRNPLQAEGWMEIGDGEIIIYSSSAVAHHGDVVETTTGNKLYVKSRVEVTTPIQVYETFRRTLELVKHDNLKYQYRLMELQAPKKICGVPVIMVHGKYRQFMAGKYELIKISFMPIMSTFKES